jgi:kynurenine formamidase
MSSRPHSNEHDSSSRRLAAIAGQLGSVTSSSVQTIARRPPSSARPQREWKHLPTFKELPREGGFPGCAWNVWGHGDQLGTVNLLTDHVVAKTAREEIRSGHAISLNWPVHLPLQPMFGRRAAEHKLIAKHPKEVVERRQAVQDTMRRKGYQIESRVENDDATKAPLSDDELHINTQSGTQWDGLRHFGHISLNCFYQGIPRQDIQSTFDIANRHTHNPHVDEKAHAAQLGIQNWAQHGIVGRGVLLDVWGYLWRKHGRQPYDPCSSHAITLDVIKEVARAQGVRFRQGDILLLRLGFIQRYQNSTEHERQSWAKASPPALAGVEQGEHVLEWIWDNHFSAIASDQPALERWPCPVGLTHLHETLLAFYGMPIGEMFDLEELCMHAQKTRRWTFYFSSWPMNIYGGAASPANASALF